MGHRFVNDIRLTQEQISQYRNDGFLVIENLLSEEHLEHWRKSVCSAASERGDDHRMPEKGQDDVTNVNLDYYKNVFQQRINLWQTNDSMREILMQAGKEIGRVACALEGVPAMRLWHDQCLIKPPFANPTSWHTDVPFWSFDSEHAISIWIALDDATLENGCLHFLRGSHEISRRAYRKKGKFDEIKIGTNMADLFALFPEMMECPVVPAPMKAGHAAGSNMTNKPRRAMTHAS